MITSKLSQHSYQRSLQPLVIPNENVQKSQEKDPSTRSSSAKRRKKTCQNETETWSGRKTRGSQAQKQIGCALLKRPVRLPRRRQEEEAIEDGVKPAATVKGSGAAKSPKKTQPHAGTSRATGGSDESQMGCEESCRRREHTAKPGACDGGRFSAAVKTARARTQRDAKAEGDSPPPQRFGKRMK